MGDSLFIIIIVIIITNISSFFVCFFIIDYLFTLINSPNSRTLYLEPKLSISTNKQTTGEMFKCLL